MPGNNRYVDEPDYGRDPRALRRERDSRDVREPRETVRERREPREQRMDIDQRLPMPRVVEPEIIRGEQRAANSGVPRREAGVLRNVPNPRDRDEDMNMYDVRPNQYAPVRDREMPARRTPYEGEFDDMPASIRPIIVDPGRTRDDPRPNYNEYFLPGDGIDREVIQSEICRYLGQDATCKPGASPDVRPALEPGNSDH